MQNVLLAGDTHGDAYTMMKLTDHAAGVDADLFVLGDFGYWEHADDGRFLDTVSSIAEDRDVTVHFLDGNHENHPMLWSKYGRGRGKAAKVRRNLYYHGRGQRWEWSGVKFMSLGGAASVDKGQREPWLEWWPTELIEDEDVTYSMRGGEGSVDVLLTHDAPRGVDHVFLEGNPAFKTIHPASNANRDKLQTVINILRPEFIYHGHMHINHRTPVDYGWGLTWVTGLENTDLYHDPTADPLRGTRLISIENGEVIRP